MIKMKRRLRVLNSFGPQNPNRNDPDYWWRETQNGRVWVGPVSGEEWRARYKGVAYVGKPKPAPRYVLCWFHQQQRSVNVCALRPYDACTRCNVPTKLYFWVWINVRLTRSKKFQELIDRYLVRA